MPIFQVHGHIKVNYSDAGRYMDYFSSARRRARLHIRIVSTQRGVRNVPLRCRQPSSPYNIGTGLTSARLRRRCRASFEPNRFAPMSDDNDLSPIATDLRVLPLNARAVNTAVGIAHARVIHHHHHHFICTVCRNERNMQCAGQKG